MESVSSGPKELNSVCVVDQKASLGEGPIWDSRRNRLLWIDVLGAQIFEFDPESGSNRTMDLSMHTAHVTTVVPCSNSSSRVVLGITEGFALYDLDTGDFVPHVSNPVHNLNADCLYPAGEPELGDVAKARMNDGKCDGTGRLWCGSLVRDGKRDIVMDAGALYTLDKWSAKAELVLTKISVSNGLAWHGNTMYYTDSPTFGVDKMDFPEGALPTDVVATRSQAFKVAENFPPVPDGCCLDTDGKLWVALFGDGAVKRIDPETGEVLAVVRIPEDGGKQSTACAFGGRGLTELYVTTATEYFSDEDAEKYSKAGGLFKVGSEQVGGVTGAPVHHFACDK